MTPVLLRRWELGLTPTFFSSVVLDLKQWGASVSVFSAVSWRLNQSLRSRNTPSLAWLGLHNLSLAFPSWPGGYPDFRCTCRASLTSRQRGSGTSRSTNKRQGKKFRVWTNWFLLFHLRLLIVIHLSFPRKRKILCFMRRFRYTT